MKEAVLPVYDKHFPKKLGEYQRKLFDIAIDLMKKHRIPFNCAFDIGAHVGHFTYNMSSIFKKVYAFEPIEDNYDCLIKNIEGSNNVFAFNFGFLDKKGKQKIYLPIEDNTGTWSVVEKKGKEKIANFETLDEFVEKMKIEEINYIKMDIQFAEDKCILGGKNTLKRMKNIILEVEIEPNAEEQRKNIMKMCSEMNYKVVQTFKSETFFVKEN